MDSTNQPAPAEEKRLVPFSNGTEADYWLSNNCHQCSRYRYYPEDPDGCKHSQEIELGFFSGDIPEKTALFVGIARRDEEEPGEQAYCTLNRICRWRSNEENPPEIVDYDQPGQLKIEF